MTDVRHSAELAKVSTNAGLIGEIADAALRGVAAGEDKEALMRAGAQMALSYVLNDQHQRPPFADRNPSQAIQPDALVAEYSERLAAEIRSEVRANG